MKNKLTTLLVLGTLIISGCTSYQEKQTQKDLHRQKSQKKEVTNYQVETRKDSLVQPTGFTPYAATAIDGGIAENVVTSTERILNKEAHFLKKGISKAIGEDKYSPWEMTSDEGGKGHNQTAPNPLTYYAVGSASSLLTQVERAIVILDLDVDNVKVETEIFFRWDNPFTDEWKGYTDKVVSNIVIESNESPEKIKELKELAIKSWAVGEGLANETYIDAKTIGNGDEHWVGHEAKPGFVGSPISRDGKRITTNITNDVQLETFPLKEDMALEMTNLPKSFTFSEVGIAESANDSTRPYMHKIQAKSLTENYETWELYSDDSKEYDGIAKAPTSWDYFTLGTSFCLMSQLTANHMYFQHKGMDIQDYRVEHQFNYTTENFMTTDMTGDLEKVITRVLVKSNATDEEINHYVAQSLACCFAGEGIQNETEMETDIFLNGTIVK